MQQLGYTVRQYFVYSNLICFAFISHISALREDQKGTVTTLKFAEEVSNSSPAHHPARTINLWLQILGAYQMPCNKLAWKGQFLCLLRIFIDISRGRIELGHWLLAWRQAFRPATSLSAIPPAATEINRQQTNNHTSVQLLRNSFHPSSPSNSQHSSVSLLYCCTH